MVIFGATGDLAHRKLMPALYNLAIEDRLPSQFICVAFARRPKDSETYRQEVRNSLQEHSRSQPIDEKVWEEFSQRIIYHQAELDNPADYSTLKSLLQDIDTQYGTLGNRIYYYSIPPQYFTTVTENLFHQKLIVDEKRFQEPWSRVIIEKPFGHDLNSALELQNNLSRFLTEQQIYRIDHYLGKETIQNLLAFRFANSFFESLWNNRHVDHVQITVAENQGVGSRGPFWEKTGMLRDIVQNHMMQLLSLIAMEPPASLTGDPIRDEKVKVLYAIRQFNEDALKHHVVRGQYSSGYIEGEEVTSYREEDKVLPESSAETYVALKLYIDNLRWAGVPFYLRSGKRMAKKATEVAITFKSMPAFLFQQFNQKLDNNVLAIRIQPDEGISLKINTKVPGQAMAIQPVRMDFRYGSYFGAAPPEAYERLIYDCMIGDNTLFIRDDETLASWKLLTPILEDWDSLYPQEFPNYSSGSWGPEAADTMIARDSRQWRLI
ncbi:MAG: glucose-6-phosphate dehydrogenase [Chlamydiota bacterium]